MDKHAGTFIFGQSGPAINYGDTPPITFDSLCDLAREAAQAKTNAQWKLGDLANLAVENNLGTLTDFATNVGLAARTVQSYAQLSSFYADTQRLYEFCNHTHYKYAHQFCRDDINTALDFLEKAESELMPCDEFYKWLKSQGEPSPLPTHKTWSQLVEENSELRELLKEAYRQLAPDADPSLVTRIFEALED